MGQFAGPALQVVGSVVSAFGALQAGQAQAGAAKFNSAVSKRNAAISRQNAQIVMQSGEAQAGIQEQKTRAVAGATKTNQAASGVDVNSGSAVDVQSSQAALGELDALTVRSNATREAYGYKVKATNEDAQSNLDDYEAKNDIQGSQIGAVGTFIGGAGDAASSYAQFKLAGSL